MRDYTDYHCHLLPAIDDGATDPDESAAMARILADFGFRTVHCTPHRIKGCFENDPDRVRDATASLQRILDHAGIALRLVPGTEHYLDEFLYDQVPGAVTPESRLLLEVPFRAGAEMVPSAVSSLVERGITPLFAHPERCRAFEPSLRGAGSRGGFSFFKPRQKEPEMDESSLILKLRLQGCRFQGNIASFAGFYGGEVKQRAVMFLRQGVYSCVGSDAHRSDDLDRILRAGYQAVAAEIGEDAAGRLFTGSDLQST